jgi:ABC-type branched-subunit amino acid transport system substrate-binding protein
MAQRLRMSAVTASAVAAGVLLAGCGSTVVTSGGGVAAGGAPHSVDDDGLSAPGVDSGELGDGLSVPGSADGPAVGVSDAGPGDSGTGPAGTDGSSSTGDTGRAGSPGSPGAATGGAAGKPARSGEPLVVGVLYSDDAQQFTGAVGGNVQQINAKRASEVMIAAYNKNGGILGHQIKPVFHSISLASSDPEGEQAAACSTFTQDNKVRLVIDAGPFQRPSLRDCLAKAGVVNVVTGLGREQEKTFERQPFLAHPVSLSLERRARVTAEGVASQGFLRTDRDGKPLTAANPVKLGVVTFEQSDYANAYESALAPAFKKAGKEVDEVFYLGNATPADTARDINAAVLRFAGLGITHVVFFASNGSVPAFFMNGASSQGYEPRYGLTSNDTPQVLPSNIADPKGQLHGSIGVGWLPGVDSVDGNKPGVAPPQQAACLKLMREGGLQGSDANSRTQLALVCDAWSFSRMAYDAGGDVAPAAFVAGENRLGTSFRSASVIATRFAPDKHDGVGAVRRLAFDDSCTCFRYTSGPQAV